MTYSGCFPACFLMALLFWSVELRSNRWRAPSRPDDPGWIDLVRRHMKGRNIGGNEMLTDRENLVAPILAEIGANDDLVYQEVFPASVLDASEILARERIPVILFFDGAMYETGIRSDGFLHSGIYLERSGENVRIVDPARRGTRGYQELPGDLFSEVLTRRVTFLRPKNLVRVGEIVRPPGTTLRDFGVEVSH